MFLFVCEYLIQIFLGNRGCSHGSLLWKDLVQPVNIMKTRILPIINICPILFHPLMGDHRWILIPHFAPSIHRTTSRTPRHSLRQFPWSQKRQEKRIVPVYRRLAFRMSSIKGRHNVAGSIRLPLPRPVPFLNSTEAL